MRASLIWSFHCMLKSDLCYQVPLIQKNLWVLDLLRIKSGRFTVDDGNGGEWRKPRFWVVLDQGTVFFLFARLCSEFFDAMTEAPAVAWLIVFYSKIWKITCDRPEKREKREKRGKAREFLWKSGPISRRVCQMLMAKIQAFTKNRFF